MQEGYLHIKRNKREDTGLPKMSEGKIALTEIFSHLVVFPSHYSPQSSRRFHLQYLIFRVQGGVGGRVTSLSTCSMNRLRSNFNDVMGHEEWR